MWKRRPQSGVETDCYFLKEEVNLIAPVCTRDYEIVNIVLWPKLAFFYHNYNKIVKFDWLSTALISALIGQFNRTVRVMPK